MNTLLMERIIRFAEGNGYEAKKVLNADGNREAQLLVGRMVILPIPIDIA